ncbi:MAG: tRNA lysidine(34) synthetase TilS [Pirellulaceae bacterium]
MKTTSNSPIDVERSGADGRAAGGPSPVDGLLGRLERAWPAESRCDVSVLVAVSGGPDSVALLRLLHTIHDQHVAKGTLHVAHFNHQWRGEASCQDAEFVEDLAGKLGMTLHMGEASPVIDQGKATATEAGAREERYRFLTQTAATVGARYVVTGHTADDQVETILHRIIRGTGITGLGGMPRTRQLHPAVTLLRPLLEFRRRDLLDYLQSIEQPYRWDSTNDDVEYMRNRIRHELLPELATRYNPRVDEAVLRLGSLAQQLQGYLDTQVESIVSSAIVAEDAHAVTLDALMLRASDSLLLAEFFQALWRRRNWPMGEMGMLQWQELARLARGDHTDWVINLPGNILVRLEGARVTVSGMPMVPG